MNHSRLVGIALCCLLLFCACGKTYESSIPSVSFSFSCNLNQSPYYTITTAGQFLMVNKNVNGLHVGYGGLIIGRSIYSSANEYCAFDAACPVEANPNVVVTLKNDGLGTAVCPKCGATYDLSNYGCRSDGEGAEVLRHYTPMLNGSILIVTN